MDLLRRLSAFLDRPLFPWKKLFYGFTIGEYLLGSYLSWRQYGVLCRTVVPKTLKNEIDQDTFDKSQAYGRAKAKFEFITGLVNQLENIGILFFDMYPKFWAITGTWILRYFPARFSGEITHSLVFLFAYAFLSSISTLPFSYYSHFVLEESFGFNKMTVSTWILDTAKGWLLTLGFGIPLGSAVLAIIQKTGESFFYYLWIFALVTQMFAITIYPIVIVPMFNKLSPLEPGNLKTAIDQLAAKLKFPLTELQVIDGSKRSSHSNAYFTGLPWKKKIVLFDTLIEKSEEQEVVAVLAHELGHWKMGHTTKQLVIAQGHLFFVFTLFSAFIHNRSLYDAFGFYREQPIIIGFTLFNMALAPIDTIVSLAMNILSRKFEYEADAFGAQLGYSTDLARSLIKLQIQNLSAMDADWMYSAFHFSHPILTERLRALGWTSEEKVSKTADSEKPSVVTNREL